MPKEVKAFACSFGGGRKVLTSRKAMEAHEQTCAMNPVRRACKICKNRTTYHVAMDAPGYFQTEHGCEKHALPYGAVMHFDCNQWEYLE